jgi:hypothetical protein
MKLKPLEILIGVTVSAITYFMLERFKRKKMDAIYIKDEYTVPANAKNKADALHSFERRKSDGFGGFMSTKIKKALRDLYAKGINPDITELKINVDSKNYKVQWEAKIEPSKDGKAYVGISTVGSAGSGADERAKNQIDTMKKWVANAKDYTLVLDFKNPKGIYIRQYFYKWTNPTEYPPHK